MTMATNKRTGPRRNEAPPVSDEDLEAESAAFAELVAGVSFVDRDGNEVQPKAAAEAGPDPIEDGEEVDDDGE